MKTKEEIWNETVAGWKLSMTKKGHYNAMQAMDEWAKQQCIAFGEWLRENHWFPQEHLGKPDSWRFFNHNTEEEQDKSTQELFAQFIEDQNKNNP